MWWILVPLGLIAYFLRDDITEVVDDAAVSAGAPLPSWTQYDSLFQKYGQANDVDWTWLKAFALNESNLGQASSVAEGIANPSDIDGSTSSDGKSWGLMQMTVSTAQGLDGSATPQKLNNPDYSVNLAARYVEDLKGYFDESNPRFLEYVVKSYNQGPGNTQKEIAGTGGGYANTYWSRFQTNLTKVQGG